MEGKPDWLEEAIRTRNYKDPRLDGSFLAFQLAAEDFRHVLMAALLDSWLGCQIRRFYEWSLATTGSRRGGEKRD